MGHKVVKCDVCGSYVMEGRDSWKCDYCKSICSELTGWIFKKVKG